MNKYIIGSMIGTVIGIIGIYTVEEQFELFATILMISFSGFEFSQAKCYFGRGNKTKGYLCMILGGWILLIYLVFLGMYIIFHI